MFGDHKRKVVGRILLVQEDRFRLMTEDGQGYLLALAHNASVTNDDLITWHKDNLRVSVSFEGEPNLESGIVESVTPLPQ